MRGARLDAQLRYWLFVAGVGLAAPGVVACRPAAVSSPHRAPTSQEWARARAELAALRATEARAPYVANVHVTMHDPSGRVVDGRGGIAVDPHRALRMILIGPGGLTAIDAWVTVDAWRFAVPALKLVRRGFSVDAKEARRLPIGFLRWWFLAPLDGNLLWASIQPRRLDYVLRDPQATVEMSTAHEPPFLHLVAVRTEKGESEEIDSLARSLTPSPGDRATYVQRASGLRIDVVVDGLGEAPPDARAFEDPDSAAGAGGAAEGS